MADLETLLTAFTEQVKPTGVSIRSWMLRQDGVLLVDLDGVADCAESCDVPAEILQQRLERKIVGSVSGVVAVRVGFGIRERSLVDRRSL